MKLKCLSSLLLCGAMSLSILPIEAWSQTSASDNDAIVRFDFNLKRMRENALVANAGADQMLQQVLPPGQADIDIKKIDRVYGGMTAPASMQEAQSAMSNSSDNLPVNFFVRIVFSDKDAATAMLDSLKTNGRVVEANGKTYIAPPANDRDPQNMRAHLADDKTFEIGTTDYITGSDRNVFTKSLVANWEKLSKNDAIRISVDVTGMQGLFDEGVDMARQQVPPQMTGVVEMGSSLAGLSVGMDIELGHDADTDCLRQRFRGRREHQGRTERNAGFSQNAGPAKHGHAGRRPTSCRQAGHEGPQGPDRRKCRDDQDSQTGRV